MKFRPCIDIHNGKVKQLVGGSLKDKGNRQKKTLCLKKTLKILHNYIRRSI